MAEPVEIVLLAKDQFSGVLGDIKKSLGEINPIAAGAATAVIAIGTALYKAAEQTVDYADEVRKLMQLTGQSAEESSRVIQVMDDYKVSVGTLTTATRILSKQGLSLNIETLAKLSDEYKKLGSGAEKTAFLIQNFGRSGLQMAEAMEQGGDAIRAASDAMDKHLILTDKEVKAAREYQRQVDNLNDTWTGFTYLAGNKTIPILNALLENINDNIQAGITWGSVLRKFVAPVEGFYQLVNILKNLKSGTDEAGVAADGFAERWMRASSSAKKALEEQVASLEELSKANSDYIKDITKLGGIEKSYNQDMADIAKQRMAVQQELTQAINDGFAENSDKVQGYRDELSNLDAKMNETVGKHREAIQQIILDNTLAKLSVDGLTDAEMEQYLQVELAFGKITEKDKQMLDAQNKLSQAFVDGRINAEQLKTALENLPTTKNIDLLVNLKGSGADYLQNQNPAQRVPGRATPAAARAEGGPVAMGQTYLVGERGPELFVPGKSGTIIPNGAGGGGGNISLSVNVTGGIINDPAEVGRQMVPALRYALRQLGVPV